MMIPKPTRNYEIGTAAALLAVACVLGFAPDAFVPMLARAFLLEWTFLFAGFALCAVWWRRLWWTCAAALGALMVLFQLDAPVDGTARERGGPGLRIAQFNLLQPNSHHSEVVRMALASDADVISFQEVSPRWAEVLQRGLASRYPYAKVVPNDRCYGIALFSRLPVTRMRVQHLSGSPVIEAGLDVNGGAVNVITVHATSPDSPSDHRERNAQLKALASLVRSCGERTIVVGDLNTVSWDRAMWQLCAASGLRLGSGPLAPTFPSVLGLALIPIDHVLTTPGTHVVHSDTFLIPGSDHRGLVADIAT